MIAGGLGDDVLFGGSGDDMITGGDGDHVQIDTGEGTIFVNNAMVSDFDATDFEFGGII